ncbi:putative alpha/beta fold family hydrolase [Aspergillus steynii IBT 23096]|uniref:Putative alpha/beta fold family hydrolase n=1 Tax=Aspergillus steynii IBT 23096 TaxID=1392250 RepID=A0A2I2FX61_9EURO|nr:putative alpha/beta fold family hydrolase [Aspergillus steynii IBT 23096]PLB45235.1 putative alpha/beta fold family hydrolase [Aspergillus steynii IBT 23096]
MQSTRLALRGASSVRSFSTSRILRSDLSFQVFGPEKEEASRSPIVFLHGLFGSKQNNRSISRALARDLNRQIFTLDLRNHGQSFHAQEHNYSAMAEDVTKFIHQQNLNQCVLIGHSMGAKTAMTVALDSPGLVSALIPVDNAPVNAALKSDFGKYVQGMQHVEAENVTKQSDADKILQGYEESLPIRQFLLTNLVRSEEDKTMKFRVPLSVIGSSLDQMADFPYQEPGQVTYEGPTLFVRGTKSRYVSNETIPAIRKFFPRSQIADVEAGHWLISENPEAFRQVVVKFLQETP